ncbi:MAG: MoxR-like ATPase [Verrucomicrobiales bacterium]|jgi:MoxR-like ATPase
MSEDNTPQNPIPPSPPSGPIAQPQAEAASPTVALMQRIKQEVGRVFIGQDTVVEQVLAAFLAGGHVLLEGKPGLGKTHLVLALAKTFDGAFSRIQFTPDLMPSDVTGHTMFDMQSQSFRVRRGPVFTNLLLADEINRAPAKTQAALLEVMQESQVTLDGETLKLDPPFMTFATQNPIEQEGTYPLPEAQLDRFLLKVLIDYPDATHEQAIVTHVAARSAEISPDSIETVCSTAQIIEARIACAAIKSVPEVVEYAVNLVRITRESHGISLGAGTRGAISLLSIAKAFALMAGRDFVTPDDVKRGVLPVLRHRVKVAPEVAISGQSVEGILEGLIRNVPSPRQ